MSKKHPAGDPLLWIFILALLLLIIFHQPAKAGAPLPERWYQDMYCEYTIEHTLPNGARVDCLTPTLAIEYDFARKWYEAIGQSLYYAMLTNRKAAIALIVTKTSDIRYYSRAVRTIEHYDLPIEYILIDERYE